MNFKHLCLVTENSSTISSVQPIYMKLPAAMASKIPYINSDKVDKTHPKPMLFLIQINAFEHVGNPPKPAEMPRGYKTNLNRCFLLYEHI